MADFDSAARGGNGKPGVPAGVRPPTTAREVRTSIERSLKTRSARPGTTAHKIEEKVKTRLENVWKGAKKRPSIGVLVAVGIGIAAAELIGVGELAVAVGFGYAAYQVLRMGVPLDKAIEETERMIR